MTSYQKKPRIIARLEIKGTNLIKGIQLEGLRVIGKPSDYANKYYTEGVDELIYSDVVASLYGRNSLHDVVQETAKQIFVPLTVGGGVRSTEDVNSLLSVGADKVSVNTAAVKDPDLITRIANTFGSQCCVVEIQAKKTSDNEWTVLVDNGREPTGINVLDWTNQVIELGAGEILLTSIDRDGTRSGVDLQLILAVSKVATVPVIASGGVGTPEHVVDALLNTNLHSIAIADMFHYQRATISDVKEHLSTAGLEIRQ